MLGRQFVIRTGHSALQSLRRTAEPIGQQARWQTFIEQFGIPTEQPPAAYDDFSVTMEERMKQAYCLVRQHLGKAAERMKRQYDIRVRPHEYRRDERPTQISRTTAKVAAKVLGALSRQRTHTRNPSEVAHSSPTLTN